MTMIGLASGVLGVGGFEMVNDSKNFSLDQAPPGEFVVNVISILNQKGGSGKSSTAVHVGGALALLGHRVLLVDNDPQASLTQGFFGPQATEAMAVTDGGQARTVAAQGLPTPLAEWRRHNPIVSPQGTLLTRVLAGEPYEIAGPFGLAFDPLSGRWARSADAAVNYLMTIAAPDDDAGVTL